MASPMLALTSLLPSLVLLAILIVIAVLTRGMARLLGVIGFVVLIVGNLLMSFLLPRLLLGLGTASGIGVILGVVGTGHQIVVLGLVIAAAAVGSRARPQPTAMPAGGPR